MCVCYGVIVKRPALQPRVVDVHCPSLLQNHSGDKSVALGRLFFSFFFLSFLCHLTNKQTKNKTKKLPLLLLLLDFYNIMHITVVAEYPAIQA